MSKLTKIVATISDKRCDVDFIQELFNEGMDIIDSALIDIRTSRYARGYQMVDFGEGNIKRVNFKFSID